MTKKRSKPAHKSKIIIRWSVENRDRLYKENDSSDVKVNVERFEWDYLRGEFGLFLLSLPEDHDIIKEMRIALSIIDKKDENAQTKS